LACDGFGIPQAANILWPESDISNGFAALGVVKALLDAEGERKRNENGLMMRLLVFFCFGIGPPLSVVGPAMALKPR
jgi:hypothetical protein